MHIIFDNKEQTVIIIGDILSLHNQFINQNHKLHFDSFNFIFEYIGIKLYTQEEIC